MSSPGQVAGATQDAAGQTAATAKEQASQVGTAATSAAADVASTTKEQAGAVAGEAVSQVRSLLDQTRAQVGEQAGGAQQKLGESLHGLADELRSMGDGSGSGSGPAAELARQLADRGSAVADYVSSKQPGELLGDLRSLAARRPGGFLLGALAAGLLAGRLTRGATAAAHEQAAHEESGLPATVPPAEPYAPIAYQTAEPTVAAPVGGHVDELDLVTPHAAPLEAPRPTGAPYGPGTGL